MDSVIVAIPNDGALAEELGKKGSQNGITYYNRKVGGNAIVIVTPTDASSKFYAVGEIMTMADVVVISTSSLDQLFGESVIIASLLGKKTIFTDDNDVSTILKSAKMDGYEISGRKELAEKLGAFSRDPSQSTGELRIDIDKSFPVKGVGTVLLGIVRSGKVKVHDTLHSSGGIEVPVRSIQVHDEDQQEALSGDRVGLAVKGVDHDSIGKGDILSKDKRLRVESIRAEIRKSPLAKDMEIDGLNCTLVSGFSAVNCKISKDEDAYSVKMEKPVSLWKGDCFVLTREKAPRAFASGTVLG